MRRTDFHFDLPAELIAQRPPDAALRQPIVGAPRRGRRRRGPAVPRFSAAGRPADLLVFNDTRVVPARIHGVKDSGGKIELLLERALDATTALVHARASKGLRPGARVILPGGAEARMLGREGDLYKLQFSCDVLPYLRGARRGASAALYRSGAGRRRPADAIRRCTRANPGAVAAPTAGLHFDERIFAELERARRRAVVRHAARRRGHLPAGAVG